MPAWAQTSKKGESSSVAIRGRRGPLPAPRSRPSRRPQVPDHPVLVVDGGILDVAVQLDEVPREEDGDRDRGEPLAVLVVRVSRTRSALPPGRGSGSPSAASCRRRGRRCAARGRRPPPGAPGTARRAGNRTTSPRRHQDLAGPPGWAASHAMAAAVVGEPRPGVALAEVSAPVDAGPDQAEPPMSKPSRARFSGEPANVTYSSKVIPWRNDRVSS